MITAGIDKINAYFFEQVNVERIKERVVSLGLSYAPERIGIKNAYGACAPPSRT